jgi:Pre-SET motif
VSPSVKQASVTPSSVVSADRKNLTRFPSSSNFVIELPVTPEHNQSPQNSTTTKSMKAASSCSSSNALSPPLRTDWKAKAKPSGSSVLSSVLAPYYATLKRSQKDRIQAEWDAAVRSAKAATIEIINEIDDEIIALPNGFTYLEHGYWSENGVDVDEFISGCDCEDGLCRYPNNCCTGLMQMDQRIFPYTKQVTWNFSILFDSHY